MYNEQETAFIIKQTAKTKNITIKQLLENSSLPFAERILESIKRDEAEMLQAQEEGRMAQLQGIPSEVIGQIRA